MSQSRKRDEQSDSTSEMEGRESLVVGRQRKDRSGEYPRTEYSTVDDDAIFATLSADVDAAVDRMQRQLDQSGDQTLQDTSEIAPIAEDASAVSARFKVDGSVVPSPRASLIRELRPREEASGTTAYELNDDEQTIDSPRLPVNRPAGIEAPIFEKTLLGPSLSETLEVPSSEPTSDPATLEHPQQNQDVDATEQAPMLTFQQTNEIDDNYDDDGQTSLDDSFADDVDDSGLGYDDDGFTELDRGDNFDGDDVTSPSRAYQLAGREQTYDPSEIDDVVQFHEGPTAVSTGHHLHSRPSDTEERMHPWFDSAPVRAPRERNSDAGLVTKPHNSSHVPPGTSPLSIGSRPHAAPQQPNAPHSMTRIESFVRAFVEKCSTTTLQINLGYLLIIIAGVGLFAATTFLAWLITSP